MHLHLAHPHLPHAGSLTSHLTVWVHQFELDRSLADGADPASSPDLKMRAEVLVSRRCRRRLVAELDSVRARAAHPPHWHSATLPVCAGSVLAAADALERLGRALQACDDPPVRGVALASCLINDPDGPLYCRATSHTIAALAGEATAVLSLASTPTTRGASGSR